MIDLQTKCVCGSFTVPCICGFSDAASELEQERVERALAWQRARAEMREARERARGCPFVYFGGVKHYEAHHVDALLDALNELERLEGGL